MTRRRWVRPREARSFTPRSGVWPNSEGIRPSPVGVFDLPTKNPDWRRPFSTEGRKGSPDRWCRRHHRLSLPFCEAKRERVFLVKIWPKTLKSGGGVWLASPHPHFCVFSACRKTPKTQSDPQKEGFLAKILAKMGQNDRACGRFSPFQTPGPFSVRKGPQTHSPLLAQK